MGALASVLGAVAKRAAQKVGSKLAGSSGSTGGASAAAEPSLGETAKQAGANYLKKRAGSSRPYESQSANLAGSSLTGGYDTSAGDMLRPKRSNGKSRS